MEKFSAFRDPGTGINPFLTPASASNKQLVQKALLPLGIIVGVARVLVVVAVGLLYFPLDSVFSALLVVPPIRIVKRLFAAVFARLILFVLGFWWIPVEVVTKKRGRNQKDESWSPRTGDIIVSNWISWVELLWLAFKFDPTFVLPITDPVQIDSGTFSSKNRQPTPQARVLGFKVVSIWSMITHTGSIPTQTSNGKEKHESLEQVRKRAHGPIVVFPECTTSNGQGLLRFADVFNHRGNTPVNGYRVFLMCIRYQPTSSTPSISHPIPSNVLNPLMHLFTLASTLTPLEVFVRLLAPSESPSSGAPMPSNVPANGFGGGDALTEASATLISQVGKMKRTGLGWEDKASFLEFYNHK